MKAKGLFTVAKQAFLPSDERARGMFAPGALKIGDKVLIKVHRARNPEHNALAHVVFDRVARAIGRPMKTVKLWLKWETGHIDLVQLPTGKYLPEARSLKFESMGQDEFQEWWDEALLIMQESVLTQIPQEEFDEIRAIITGESKAT